ncbi:MAG: NAD(P)H-dependent oxidoreductase [Limnohabitans sp.]
MSQLLEKMQWRYATKKMDPNQTVPQDKVDRIVEAARLAPSSSGLQPYEVIVVRNPEVRASMRSVANDQAQITDGSHVLVFAAWDNYSPDRINHMFDLHANARGGTNDGWESYRQTLLKKFAARSTSENFEHAARQVYIALGASLIAAAIENVDSTPMEGFQPDAVDRILNLSARGLRSVTLMPLGYRLSGQDWLEPLTKVRRPRNEFVTTMD